MKTEKVLGLFAIISLLFELMQWTGAGVLLVLTLFTWAMIYFLGGGYFFSSKDIKDQNLPLSVVSGLFWSIAIIGILFKLQHYPGANMQITVGFFASIILLGVIYFLRNKAKDELTTYYNRMMLRSMVWSVLSGLFFFMVM